MKSCLTLVFVLLIATVAVPQGRPIDGPNSIFHDDLLDRLVGKWDITGTVHGSPSKQTLEAEWVLNHQFLRIDEKSMENVAGTNVPYEGLFFIGFDNTSKRYVAHLINVFGGRDSAGLGYGQRSGNEIKFDFKNLDVSVANRFIWEPGSKTWRIVVWQESAADGEKPYVDLKATAADQPSSPPAAPSQSTNQADAMKQMIELSRPSENHKLLANLVGTWKFTGRQIPPKSAPNAKAKEISGTLVRKALYEGRFFTVEVTSAENIQMPVANGGMKEVPFSGLEVEGYDNVKKKFVRASIGNHIGSNISLYEGAYDPATKTITYDSGQEIIPGMKAKVRQRVEILDSDHYKLEWYEVHDDGQEEKGTEINCVRGEVK